MTDDKGLGGGGGTKTIFSHYIGMLHKEKHKTGSESIMCDKTENNSFKIEKLLIEITCRQYHQYFFKVSSSLPHHLKRICLIYRNIIPYFFQWEDMLILKSL